MLKRRNEVLVRKEENPVILTFPWVNAGVQPVYARPEWCIRRSQRPLKGSHGRTRSARRGKETAPWSGFFCKLNTRASERCEVEKTICNIQRSEEEGIRSNKSTRINTVL